MTETVIVAHGLWMPGWETVYLRRCLAHAGFQTRLFRFHTVGETLSANARRLAEFAREVPGDAVHFVGHSLGGVVAVRMLETQPFERPGRTVCLGSPLAGSRAAARFARLPGGANVLGKCMLELLSAGGMPAWTSTREIGVVAGDVPLGFGRLLCAFAEPNDGTVAVSETRLPGAAHIVLPASHLSLLFSRRVAEETCHFLRTGRFR